MLVDYFLPKIIRIPPGSAPDENCPEPSSPARFNGVSDRQQYSLLKSHIGQNCNC